MIGYVLAPIFLMALFIAAIATIGYWTADASCRARWSEEFAPTYAMFAGCQITVNGKRIPAANYRVL